MHIPPTWVKASGDATRPDGTSCRVDVWGWGDDRPSAGQEAASRLKRVLERIGAGAPFPDPYGYGSRPLREEILQTIEGESTSEPSAIVTRNRYGAQVLNAARLLFLDVDTGTPGPFRTLLRLLGARPSDEVALARLRDALRHYGRATFRVYRTAAGFRAVAVDRAFDPADRETQDLMTATRTDPAFARLCVAQKCFRARLTPKPWRCKLPPPPGAHPRPEGETRYRFEAWRSAYEKATVRFATCRHVETIGSARPAKDVGVILELHDKITRCHERLPLA